MKITVLAQGHNPPFDSSVGQKLTELFADPRFHMFTGLSAFASQSGVQGVSQLIIAATDHLEDISIIIGVDQKATSKEALEALLELGVNTFVFYQPASPIFHPKIYLFEGEEVSTLIVGSSNLTASGLFLNVEASLCIEIDNTMADEQKIITDLKSYFGSIFDSSDPNLQPITNELIEQLVSEGIVPTEAERRIAQAKTVPKSEQNRTENLLEEIFPKRALAKIPTAFRRTKGSSGKVEHLLKSARPSAPQLGNLVWLRNSLPSSSVQGGGDGTNPTGGLRLVQARFSVDGEGIDQTTYFRNTLFGSYDWQQVKAIPLVEAATIPFHVIIKGDDQGVQNLEVRHKPSGEAGQGNYTTSISWGDLGETIRGANLRGSTLELYAPAQTGSNFTIVIS